MSHSPIQILLDALENKVELHLQEAISVFQNLSEETLLQPSPTGGWSIAQCLDHLNSYGKYYLPHISTSIEKAKKLSPSHDFKSSWLGNYFVKMMDPETGKRKFKAFKDHIPSKNLDAHAVVAEFIRQQEALLQYIKDARRIDLNKVKIPISISKWIKLNLGDVFRFIVAHDERHIIQIRKQQTPNSKQAIPS